MKKRIISLIITVFVVAFAFAGCAPTGGDEVIKFADVGWDSIKFHNAVAMIIAESAYGLETEEIGATTPITVQSLKGNDLDVLMEMWTDNVISYKDDIANGLYNELGVNFDDNMQGFYVPRYVIEGDPSRNIEPVAPDLKTVADLARYKDVFPDEEQAGKGRIYGSISGWQIDEIMFKKVQHYGLDKDFNYFRPGSEAAMAAAFTSAYEKGEPIVGYYWEPTWLTGKYDLVVLEDAPYDEALYQEGKTACPAVKVTVVVSNGMLEKAPEFVDFLSQYKTSSALTAEALAYLADNKASYEETAKWFLREHDDLMSLWLSPEKADLVREAIK